MSTFSPLDLLSLTCDEQDVLRRLIKQPGMTVTQIAAATAIPMTDLPDLLQRMVDASRIVVAERDGETTFAAYFNGGRPRQESSLLSDLFS